MACKFDVASELIEMAVGSFTLHFTLPCVVGRWEREEERGRRGGGEREEEKRRREEGRGRIE